MSTPVAVGLSPEDDRERLDDATHVLHGPEGSTARKEVAYAAYLAVILVGLYGFPVLRALVLAGDRAGMAAGLRSPWTLVVALVAVVALAAVAREAGRVRGPIVAPVPWVDLVVSSAVDRWAALRPWFGYSLFAVLFAGGLAGVLVGASFAGAGVIGWWALLAGLAGGVLLGVLVGWCWLLGQSRLSPPLPPSPRVPQTTLGRGLGHTRREVRRLGIPELRTQAARSTRIVGGVQAGDLRAVRLEAARPISHGRSLRLKPRGPAMTLIARDLLGMRRAPVAAVVGVLVSAAAGAGLGGALGSSAVPPVVAFVAALVSYLGMGALSEGLRLEADTMGTPALFGMPPVRAAAAHLVLPGTLHLLATCVAGVVTGTAAGGGVGAVLPWCVMATVFASGTSLLAAYRGRPPVGFSGVPSPQTVAFWYALPLALNTLLVGGMVWGATQWPTSSLLVITSWVASACVLFAGLNRAQKESLAHRDV